MKNQQFQSKRKKEFDSLIKKPIVVETKIQVKFPNSLVFEARFTPREKPDALIEMIKSHLSNKDLPFYLFTAPPFRKFAGNVLAKDFEDLDCLPKAIVYFGMADEKELEAAAPYLKPEFLPKV